MKKILAIGHSFVLAQNRDVFRELHEQGKCDVTVLAPRFFHGDLRDIQMEPEPQGSTMKLVPIDCYATQSIHLFFYNIWQVEKILNTTKFDAIYLWEEAYIVSGFTLAHIFHKHGIPYFLYSCQNIFKKYPWPFSFLEKKVYQHAQLLFGCGQGVREVFVEKGYSSEVIPFFVNLERFKPQSLVDKKENLNKMGLQEKFTVGFMGRLVEEKGVSLFMEALDKVADNKKCNIIVVGSGPLATSVKEWIATKENAKYLELKHHEVPAVLSLFDVMLAPSQTRPNWKEQFGRMIVEAFASGVVVLGSSSGEIPHVIGKAGKVLSETNTSEWVEAVSSLIDNPSICEDYKKMAREEVRKYSIEVVSKKLYTNISRSLNWE